MGAPLPGDPSRRVVVTGLGCVSPLGPDAPSTWEAAVEGQEVMVTGGASETDIAFGLDGAVVAVLIPGAGSAEQFTISR